MGMASATHLPTNRYRSTEERMEEIEQEIAQQLNPKQHLFSYLSQNSRLDGRKFDELKPIVVRTNVNSKCCGSSLIRWGKTIMMCEITAQVGTPVATTPQAGGIVFDLALWPICSPHYEKLKKSDEAYAIEATLRDIYLKSGAIDLEQLSITPGRHAFSLNVQIICLSRDGSFFDAIVLATSSALQSTTLPATSYDTNNRVIFLADEQHTPLRISRQLVSLTCGIFFHPDSKDRFHILLDPSTFEGDYNDNLRHIIQREVVLDQILTMVLDQDGNISHVSQRCATEGRYAGTSIELFSEACALLTVKLKQHLLPLLGQHR